jgi:hypothetical protein
LANEPVKPSKFAPAAMPLAEGSFTKKPSTLYRSCWLKYINIDDKNISGLASKKINKKKPNQLDENDGIHAEYLSEQFLVC